MTANEAVGLSGVLSTQLLLDQAFPFHLCLDESLRVTGFGRSLPKLCPGIAVGDELTTHLSADSGPDALRRSTRARTSVAVVLRTVPGEVSLRCQAIPLDGGLVLLMAPWLAGPDALVAAGLVLSDFAAHDPSPDYAFLAQAQFSALDDARRLADRLGSLEAERRLEALRDPMTGAGNRRMFTELMASLEPGAALVLVDVDHFKEVNDTHGHLAGDAVLVAVADRLRQVAPPNATITRLGGDEFGVVVTGDGAERLSRRFAHEALEILGESIEHEGRRLRVSVSIGLMAGGDPNLLMRNADIALYSAKQRGRGRVVAFDPRQHHVLLDRLLVHDRLGEAVANNRISVAYQPIVTLATGRIHGFEALARWHDPVLGQVPPDVFIPVAEDAGLIGALGRSVLASSVSQLAAWRCTHPWLDLTMSVNLAPQQLDDADLTEYVLSTLRSLRVPPSHLQLELTESAFTAQRRHTDHLQQLRECGIQLAIDDFGSAESTLARLHAVPASTLKIDRAFLLAPPSRLQHSARLLRAVVAIADALELATVAEGIETRDQLDMVVASGCTLGQGYLFSRPLEPAAADAYLDGPAASS